MDQKEFLDQVELILDALEIPSENKASFLAKVQNLADDKRLKIMEILVLELEKFKKFKENQLKDLTKHNENSEKEQIIKEIESEIDSL